MRKKLLFPICVAALAGSALLPMPASAGPHRVRVDVTDILQVDESPPADRIDIEDVYQFDG